MSFSWTSITAGVTPAAATHMNEVKTSVDSLTTKLSVSAYSWTVLPVSATDRINAAQVTQLQNALDYVDSMNTCATHNVTYDNGVLSSDDNSIHTGKDATIYSGNDASIHTGKDATIHSSKDVTVNSGQDVSYHNGRDITVYNPNYTSALTTRNSTNRTTKWDIAQSSADGVVWASANSSGK